MPSRRPRARRAGLSPRRWTVRTRVLSTLLAFIAGGLAITGVLTFAAQFRALDQRIDAELWQEHSELQLIANATTPDGTPVHTTVDSVLLQATDSAAPSDHESVIVFIDGEPRYQPRQQEYALLPRPEEGMSAQEAAAVEAESSRVLRALRAAHVPGRSVIVPMEADGRDLRLLIASVNVEGDDAQGVFVVASDAGAQRRDVWRSAVVFTGLSVLALLLAGWTGYVVTGRLLRPLEDLRGATEQVTVTDLEHRVPVPAADDDVSALAQNFNRMLERIQEGFAEQRRFMSDVGHELRTPLTIVRGTLETTDAHDPADVAESHAIALEELDRMGRVVGDLAELAASSRPDFVRPRPVDLAAFARSAFARLEHIGPRDWVLEQVPEGVAEVDEQRLAQALVQLAANAVRYSEEGSRVAVRVAQVPGPDGPEIHLSVRDEGVGIAEADRRRIFERFTRVEGAPGAGSGLGLPIVLAIAEGHGGTVRVNSAPGRGSTFTIVIPRVAPGTADGEGADAAHGTGSADGTGTGSADRVGEGPADGTAHAADGTADRAGEGPADGTAHAADGTADARAAGDGHTGPREKHLPDDERPEQHRREQG